MQDFQQFAESHGLIIRSLRVKNIGRCPTVSHPRAKNGAYYFDGDFGWVMDWAIDLAPLIWHDENLSPIERAKVAAKIEATKKLYLDDRKAKNENAAKRAFSLVSECILDRHAYMDAHGLGDEVVNVLPRDGMSPLMVVPMYFDGRVCGAQTITIDGEKKFLSGQRSNLAQFILGQPSNVSLDVWCEGYCTGVAIRRVLVALRVPSVVHVTFSSGNLAKMASRGIVVADNDKSKAGLIAAEKTGLLFYMPELEGEDFCDEWRRIGQLAVSQRLKPLVFKQLKELRNKVLGR